MLRIFPEPRIFLDAIFVHLDGWTSGFRRAVLRSVAARTYPGAPHAKIALKDQGTLSAPEAASPATSGLHSSRSELLLSPRLPCPWRA